MKMARASREEQKVNSAGVEEKKIREKERKIERDRPASHDNNGVSF